MKKLMLFFFLLFALKMQAQVTSSPEDQIAQITKAIEKTPTDDNLFFQRAFLYFNQDKKELAQADVSKAVNLNRENYNAYFLYGYIHLEKGEYSSAYFYANQAIKYNPKKDPKFYLLRAMGNEGSDKLENAASDYKTVLELDPTNTEAKNRLPIVNAKIKQKENSNLALKKEGENATITTKIVTHKIEEYDAAIKKCEDLTADFIKRRNADKSITMNHASVSDLKKQFKVEYLKIIKISDERIAMCPVDLQTSAGNLSTALTAKRNTFVSDWLKLTGEDIFK